MVSNERRTGRQGANLPLSNGEPEPSIGEPERSFHLAEFYLYNRITLKAKRRISGPLQRSVLVSARTTDGDHYQLFRRRGASCDWKVRDRSAGRRRRISVR